MGLHRPLTADLGEVGMARESDLGAWVQKEIE